MNNILNLTKTFELKTLRAAARVIDVSVAAVASGGYFLIDRDGAMLGAFEPPVPWSFDGALDYIKHYSRMQSEGLTDDRELVVELMAQSFGIRVVAVEGGFHLFDVSDDRQLGFDDMPWSREDVVAFCQKFAESQRTGVFVA